MMPLIRREAAKPPECFGPESHPQRAVLENSTHPLGPATSLRTADRALAALGKFIPYARNPRKNDHVIDRMVASIREFGFKVPVLARSSGDVIDGHLRLKAAEKLGITEIPVILCDDWTDAQVKAFRLLVNRSVTWADWDSELLSLELLDLKGAGFDLELSGFDMREIDELLLSAGDTQPDPP